MAISSVRRWAPRFRNGDDSTSDKPSTGRPSSASTPEAIEEVNGVDLTEPSNPGARFGYTSCLLNWDRYQHH